jgi:ribose transport system permease protein
MREKTAARPATVGAPAALAATAPASAPRGTSVGALLLRFGMVWVLIALVIAAQLIYPGFLAWGNIQNLLAQNAQIGIIAVGMTFVLIGGGFDLSVGAIYAAGAVLYADLANSMPFAVAFVLVMAMGLAMGTVNGLMITRLRINPFVATLGSASVFGGGAYIYSHSSPIINNKPGFEQLGQYLLGPLPITVWMLIVAFAIGGFVLAKTVYGRSLYAVGGNDEASRLAGLRVDALRASTYVLVGACAAIGGAIIASRLQVGQADVGATVALDAIAIVVIGGTSLFGGEGAVWRSAIGLLILAVITNLCNSEGVDTNVQSVIKGAIVVGAVALDSYSRRRRA